MKCLFRSAPTYKNLPRVVASRGDFCLSLGDSLRNSKVGDNGRQNPYNFLVASTIAPSIYISISANNLGSLSMLITAREVPHQVLRPPCRLSVCEDRYLVR